MTEDVTAQLKALRQDDTYYPPAKPRPRIKAPWRVEWPEQFPVTLSKIDKREETPDDDNAA